MYESTEKYLAELCDAIAREFVDEAPPEHRFEARRLQMSAEVLREKIHSWTHGGERSSK